MSWFGKVFPTEFGSVDVWGGLLNALFGTAVNTDVRQQLTIAIKNPSAETIRVLCNTRFPFEIQDLTYVTSGTLACTVAIQINSSNVTGLTALAATTTEGTAAASADYTASAGDDVQVALTSVSGTGILTLNLWYNRTGEGTS